jgi:hypothetical protein
LSTGRPEVSSTGRPEVLSTGRPEALRRPPAAAATASVAAAAVGEGGRPFRIVVEGIDPKALARWWRDLCTQDASKAPQAFRDIYPNVRSFEGNAFQFRGGDPAGTRDRIGYLLEVYGASPSEVRIE